jgi:hypothetical protein
MFNPQQFEQQVADEVKVAARGARTSGPSRRLDVQRARLVDGKREAAYVRDARSRIGCLGQIRMVMTQLIQMMQVDSTMIRRRRGDDPKIAGASRGDSSLRSQ